MRTPLPVLCALVLGASIPSRADDGEIALRAEDAWEGRVRRRVTRGDGAELVVLHGGEQRGRMGTCSCPSYPLGSLERIETYRRTAVRRDADTPYLLVDPGYWLDDTIGADGALRHDVDVGNAWMVRGLEAGQWDALNVTTLDLPWLATRPSFPSAAVSANVRPVDPATPGPAPFLVVERGGVRVAITGVTADVPTFLQPEAFAILDPVEALAAVLPEASAAAEVVVVLAYEPKGRIGELMALPGVDLVVEAGGFQERYPPRAEGEAVVVRSDRQARRLGEARLQLEDGRIVALVDRSIDMDAAIRPDRRVRSLAEEADAAIRAAQILW